MKSFLFLIFGAVALIFSMVKAVEHQKVNGTIQNQNSTVEKKDPSFLSPYLNGTKTFSRESAAGVRTKRSGLQRLINALRGGGYQGGGGFQGGSGSGRGGNGGSNGSPGRPGSPGRA